MGIVDTGTGTLVINEELSQQLGLEIFGERLAVLANGSREIAKKASPVEVQWKNRTMICQPLFFPDCKKILLGAVPLQEMDLILKAS